MKKCLLSAFTMLLLFAFFSISEATLITIGTAGYDSDGSGSIDTDENYNLIWDDDNNGKSLIWLDYTNSHNSWVNQMSWAQELKNTLNYNHPGYIVNWGLNSWRLPAMVDGIYVEGHDGNTTGGYNIISSEMGHLFYSELGNYGYLNTDGTLNAIPADNPYFNFLQQTGNFIKLIPDTYWLNKQYTYNTHDNAWIFSTYYGSQYLANETGGGGFGLAVWEGQVFKITPIPEPSTILFLGLGILGFAGISRNKINPVHPNNGEIKLNG